MTSPAARDARGAREASLLAYQDLVDGRDELLRMQADPTQSSLATSLMSGGRASMLTKERALRRLVREDGITYGGSEAGRQARPWAVDLLPLVIGSQEWTRLSAGLQQRAELLDALLQDFYGPRQLLRDKVIPAAVVLGHAGFLLPVDGIRLPTSRHLILTATDLARGDGDDWVVLSDRVQAPSGVGYTLANRRLISRVLDVQYRSTPIHRLRSYFDLMRAALEATAPVGVERPRIVLLTPGPNSETAYDQALLSSLLGHPLAQASDLLIKDGRLYLRTIGRLQPVDVLQRRVDGDWTDSLELRGESRLGAAGLVQAARQGRLSVVNPLGAAVLENPGLLPYLDGAARAVLGTELTLPSAKSWWCGEQKGLSHGLARMSELIIKPIARGVEPTYLGWELSTAQRAELAEKMKARPWEWAVQEPVPSSTAPVVTNAGLEPRRMVLRTFATALDERYHVMPGGLARVSPNADGWVVTNATGALAKDVWVLESPEAFGAPIRALPRSWTAQPEPVLPGLPPSAADNLYWLGRYVERTEATARLLNMTSQAVEDNHRRTDTPGYHAMQALLDALAAVTAIQQPATCADGDIPQNEAIMLLNRVLLDESQDGSLSNDAARTTAAAHNVRELLSADTSGVLASMQQTLRDAHAEDAEMHVQAVALGVLHSTLAFAGLSAESLMRDPTWAFQEAGRRMERAQFTVRLLSATLSTVRSPVAEALLVESVLRACDSLITYERRMAAGVGSSNPAEAALQLLLLDDSNPRSVQYQLDKLAAALDFAPHAKVNAHAARLVEQLANAQLADLVAGDRSGIRELLDDLVTQLRDLSNEIAKAHFRPLPQQSFNLLERAGG